MFSPCTHQLQYGEVLLHQRKRLTAGSQADRQYSSCTSPHGPNSSPSLRGRLVWRRLEEEEGGRGGQEEEKLDDDEEEEEHSETGRL